MLDGDDAEDDDDSLYLKYECNKELKRILKKLVDFPLASR